MDLGHDGLPDLGGQPAAGHALQGRVVVIAHPDAGDILLGEADEPGVAIAAGRAGLARHRARAQLGARAGPRADHLLHHVDQLARRALADDALPEAAGLAHQRAVIAAHGQADHAVRRDRGAAVADTRIGAGQFQKRRLGRAQPKRGAGGQVADDAEIMGDLAHAVAAHGLLQADGRGVQRLRQRLRQRHRAAEIAAVVLRRPVAPARDADRQRRVLHRVVGRIAHLQRGGIDEGLEARPGLPLGLRGAVEVAVAARVTPADHGTHRAVRRHDHHRGLRRRAVAHLLVKDALHRPFGRALDALVKGRGDGHVLGRLAGQEARPRFHHPIRKGPARAGRCGLRQRRRIGAVMGDLLGGQIALFLHQAQDHAGPRLAARQIGGRRVIAGCAQQARQHRGFGGIHLACGLVEVTLAGGLEAARPGAQIGPVHVDVEDVVLGILRLHREGVGDFLDLAPYAARPAVGLELGLVGKARRIEGLAKAEKLCHLLRDGRPAVTLQRAAAVGHVDADRAGDAARADAQMAVEAPVLGRDHGLFQDGGDLVGGHRTEGLAAPGKDAAVAVQHRHRAAGAAVEQILGIGQGGVEIGRGRSDDQADHHGQPPDRSPDDPPDQHDQRREPADNAPPARAARIVAPHLAAFFGLLFGKGALFGDGALARGLRGAGGFCHACFPARPCSPAQIRRSIQEDSLRWNCTDQSVICLENRHTTASSPVSAPAAVSARQHPARRLCKAGAIADESSDGGRFHGPQVQKTGDD